jgi:hypothetical protein
MKLRAPQLVPGPRRRLLLTALGGIVAGPLAAGESEKGPVMDFSDPDVARRLWVVNDGVMGGVSQSRLRQEAQGVVFEGAVSLRNNGGFASLRGPLACAAGTSALELTVQGDGKRYKLLLRMDTAPGAPSYQCDFDATGLQVHRFSAADFQATFRGRVVAAAPLTFPRVTEFGILISDKQEGAFVLQLLRIGTA